MRSIKANMLPVTGGQPQQILAALLLLVCAGLGWQLWQQPRHTVSVEPTLVVPTPAPALSDTATDKAMTQAQDVVHTPWLALFGALESIHSSDIYWLTLTPNRKQQRIHMRLMSAHRASGWAYVQRLKRLPMLREVKLLSSAIDHTANLQEATPMMVFEVEATWQY